MRAAAAVVEGDEYDADRPPLGVGLVADRVLAKILGRRERAASAPPRKASISSPVTPPPGAKPVRVGTAVVGHRVKPSRGTVSVSGLRLASIGKLIRGRHGGGPCDTDDAVAYAMAALPHLIAIAHSKARPVDLHAWAAEWTPALLADRGEDWFAAIVEDHLHKPRRLTADAVAKLLRVTDEERRRLDLRTFGAVDRPKRQRTADRKAADRFYQASRRSEKGAKPHVHALSTMRPWEALGISRRTWYRRFGTNSSAPNTSVHG